MQLHEGEEEGISASGWREGNEGRPKLDYSDQKGTMRNCKKIKDVSFTEVAFTFHLDCVEPSTLRVC